MMTTSVEQSIWNPRFFEQGGLFDVFHLWRDWFLLHPNAFPDLRALSLVAAEDSVAEVRSGGGFPIRFVKQQRVMRNRRNDLGWHANYQLRIFLTGEVPSRPDNWHDFFNAWTWIYLPKLKAAINSRHFSCIDETSEFPWKTGGGNRSREQDMLTLFDEGGLLVVTDDDGLWDLLSTRRWQDFFREYGTNDCQRVMFIPVGHALFECALKGHPRLHASCIRVNCRPSEFSLSTREGWKNALATVDELAALKISRRTHLRSPDELHALPIWGIHGWHPRAGEDAFLSDSSYFR
ncbi:MAG: hypothetical protein RL189_188 [Pseudomonadota bacterium]|jgi:hypothetical protein